MTECTISQYLESKTTLLGKIQAYDRLIDSMELKLLEAISDSDLSAYTMEDGQMKTRVEFRSISAMEAAVSSLEKSKQRYVNRYNGHVTTLRGRLNR